MTIHNQKRKNNQIKKRKNKRIIIVSICIGSVFLISTGAYLAFQKNDNKLKKEPLFTFIEAFEKKRV